MCNMLGVSKQAYYKMNGDTAGRRAAKEAFALEYVHQIRKHDKGIGGLKLWYMYKREFPEEETIGRDWLADLLHRHNLNCRKRVRKPKTTDSSHGLPVFPNLVYDFIPVAVNQLWVSDITYIPIHVDSKKYFFCYLSLIMDAYSHEIIGWSVGSSLESRYTKEALAMAFKRLENVDPEVVENLIHHSDRGVQYASRAYIKMLQDKKIKVSMTESGNPKDNAMAERINLTIKGELLKGIVFHSLKEVRDAVETAVIFYNTKRPHMSIDMMTPQEAAQCNGEIKKWWRCYRDEAIKNITA